MQADSNGFTLLELLTAVGVIVILAVIAIPVYSGLRARAQRVQCVANLRSLYTGANLFVQQNGSWPQIPRNDSETGREEYAEAWIEALAPFSVPRKSWICPAIENMLDNEDYSTPETARIDYIPMPFDDKPITPHLWPNAPWFVEVGDVHGSGNLIIFADGSVIDLTTAVKSSAPAAK